MNGIILAGGKAIRLNGIKKGLIKINNVPIIEHLIYTINTFCNKIIIVTNDDVYDYLKSEKISIIQDLIKDTGPIGGIHTGLFHTNTNKNIVLSCDMPYLTRAIIQLLSAHKDISDIVVPKIKQEIHPLCGIYSKSILPLINNQVQSGDFKLKNLLQIAKTYYLEFSEQDHLSFTNINTFKELNHTLHHGKYHH